MTPRQLPPIDYLNDCFTYDPVSGKLFWKVRPMSHFKNHQGWAVSNAQCAGTEAGSRHYQRTSRQPRHVIVTCLGRGWCAHLVIFALMGVTIPEGFGVDHKDTNPFNNAWTNLRLATSSQNNANRKRKVSKKDGLPKGVKRTGNKYSAATAKDGKEIYLGVFNTPEEAHAAYCAKAAELHGEFARFN